MLLVVISDTVLSYFPKAQFKKQNLCLKECIFLFKVIWVNQNAPYSFHSNVTECQLCVGAILEAGKTEVTLDRQKIQLADEDKWVLSNSGEYVSAVKKIGQSNGMQSSPDR